MAVFYAVYDLTTGGVGTSPGSTFGSAKALEYEVADRKADGHTEMLGRIMKLEASSLTEAQQAVENFSGGSNSKPVIVTEAAWKTS